MAVVFGGWAIFKTMTILEKILLFLLELFGVIRPAPSTQELAEQASNDTDILSPISVVNPAAPKEEPLFFVHRHRLNVDYIPSPNRGLPIVPEYLVVHYTANGGVGETVRRFQDRATQVSAHLVIGRRGEVVQMVDFNVAAWHCGRSQWRGLSGLNNHSIGIELVNWGKLTYRDGKFFTWSGREVPENETVWLPRKSDGKSYFWHAYTDAQVAACFDVAAAICSRYEILDILGHEDISPGRKQDPGPAFDMEGLREYVSRKKEMA